MWWWLGLALLLTLAGWLYLRGYNVSLPFLAHNDELTHLLAAQHSIDFGTARSIANHDAYPPGMGAVNYFFLKHINAPGAHHGAMLPALRLLTISTWLASVALIALLGYLILHPLTGLMAAAIWIVNPWVVERAHFALPDGYLTLFTLLALWLALVGCLYGRRSFSTAAVYSIILAIVFKTQAIFVAPLVLLLPMLKGWRRPAQRADAWRKTFGNGLRFAIFLFWLLLIYPTLESKNIPTFPVPEYELVVPRLSIVWASLREVLLTFQPISGWLSIAFAGALLWRYRQRANWIALFSVAFAALAWLIGLHIVGTGIGQLRQYFTMGAMLALLYATSLTGIVFFFDEAFTRLPSHLSRRYPRLPRLLPASGAALLLTIGLLPAYQESDALAHNFTLPDRRNDLARYMDASLPPGKTIADRFGPNHRTFNRAWGGYDGVHDFPLAQSVAHLLSEPLETWRANDAVYAIALYPPDVDDPDIYFPDETVLLKSFPPDPIFRGPSMVVLRLYPMRYEVEAQLGSIRLVGYDLSSKQVSAGDELVFRHYWQADVPTSSPQHVFNHLLSAEGSIVAQADYVPLFDARRPTTTWDDPHEILLGREFRLPLPLDLPAGTYQLVSGLYDPATGQRLRAPDGSSHVEVAAITIR